MKTVKDALFLKVQSTALWTSIGGRYHSTEAPVGTQTPYLVATIITDTPTHMLSHTFVDVLIEFASVATDELTTETVSGLVRSLFDRSILSGLVGYMQVGEMEWDSGYTVSADGGYQYNNEYRLQLKKL